MQEWLRSVEFARKAWLRSVVCSLHQLLHPVALILRKAHLLFIALSIMSATDIALLESVTAAWGGGVYFGENGAATVAEHIHPDCVCDASAPTKNTDMHKVYGGVGKGHAGWMEWITRLLEFDIVGK
jgi:hypothetical protein